MGAPTDGSETMTVSQTDLDAFWRDGAVVLRGALAPEWVQLLADGIDANMANPSERAVDYTPEGNTGRYFGDYCNWRDVREFDQFVRESPAAALAAQITRSKQQVRFFHEHVLVKEPGTSEKTPWHHDLPYYIVSGRQVCSLWIPVDPVPVEAAVQFVAGSHEGPLYLPRKFSDGRNYEYVPDGYEQVPDIDAELAADAEAHQIVSWAMEPGDVLAFHMQTLHASDGTEEGGHRRRAFAARFLGDDAVFATRPGTPSPPYPHVEFTAGEPVDHPEFPVVWAR